LGVGRRRKEKTVSWTSDMLGAHEEGLSPNYLFYQDHEFYRFIDFWGRTGWVVGEYSPTPQSLGHFSDVPGGVVVYYDNDGLAMLHPSMVKTDYR